MDAAFTDGVSRHIDTALERREAGGVDDTALDTPVDPVLARVLAQLERRLQVRLQHLIVDVVRELVRGDPSHHPGHVDEDLERVGLADPLDQAVECRWHAEVCDVDAALAPEGFDGGLGFLLRLVSLPGAGRLPKLVTVITLLWGQPAVPFEDRLFSLPGLIRCRLRLQRDQWPWLDLCHGRRR